MLWHAGRVDSLARTWKPESRGPDSIERPEWVEPTYIGVFAVDKPRKQGPAAAAACSA